jgi:REP element-mobilizing transposase RayT
MFRARKRHLQLDLRFADRRGGRRRNKGGRPKKGERASERHEVRPALKASQPVHVILRSHKVVGTLRRREIYQAVRKAMQASLHRDNARIVHLSIQGTHIHMLVEAHDRMALARGMQGFQISAAKRINAAMSKRLGHRRKGTVFPDRYHARIITNPHQARNCLAYVLNNWKKHREHASAWTRGWKIDAFSSASTFPGWSDVDVTALGWPSTYEPLPVWEPKTWLLREGWKKYGLLRSTEVPSAKRVSAETVIAE